MKQTNYDSAIHNEDETRKDVKNMKRPTSSESLSQMGLKDSDNLDRFIGQTIVERYQLTKVLGKGGMGVVFEANDLIENRQVAIKLLSADALSDEISRKRFYREAKMGMALTHPNIVKTYNYGNFNDELIYISMEYINNQSLREFINNNAPIDTQQILSIVEQLCDALDYAHSNGVLHRDLKPSNILLNINEDGAIEVKLADFGIAKLLSPNEDITQGTSLTETGVILGTISYIAPEYLLGLNLIAASDFYSLGVIIFEMLTDNQPIHGTSRQQLLYNKVYKDIAPPSQGYPFLPKSLDPVLCRILNRNPLARFDSGREFFQAFRQAVE